MRAGTGCMRQGPGEADGEREVGGIFVRYREGCVSALDLSS